MSFKDYPPIMAKHPPVQGPTVVPADARLDRLLAMLEFEGELAKQRTDLIQELSKVLAYPVMILPSKESESPD